MEFFVLGVSKDRVQRIARHWLNTGVPRPERRGVHRQNAEREQKKTAVRNHITSFTCRVSHYAHRGEKNRKYLPSDLNITKMKHSFDEQNHLQVCRYRTHCTIVCSSTTSILGLVTPLLIYVARVCTTGSE